MNSIIYQEVPKSLKLSCTEKWTGCVQPDTNGYICQDRGSPISLYLTSWTSYSDCVDPVSELWVTPACLKAIPGAFAQLLTDPALPSKGSASSQYWPLANPNPSSVILPQPAWWCSHTHLSTINEFFSCSLHTEDPCKSSLACRAGS